MSAHLPADPNPAELDDLPPLPAADPVSGTAPDLWGVALRARWVLLAGLVCGVVVGQMLYWKLGPGYEATARILVSKKTTARISDPDGENSTLGDRAEHIALIMSPLIVEDAVKKHKLKDLPSLKGDDDIVQTILDDLRVKRSAGSDRSVLNVLDLTYMSDRPRDGSKVVQAVIDAYHHYLDATREENAAESIKLINEASQEILKQLKAKETEYTTFRDKAPWYWKTPPAGEGAAADTTNVHQERLIAIEAERRINLIKQAEIRSKIAALNEARKRGESTAALEMLVQRFMSLDGGTFGGIGEIGDLTNSLRAEMIPLVIQENKLLFDFGPDHPDVKQVRNSMATLREFYRKQGVTLPDMTAPQQENRPRRTGEVDLVSIYIASLNQQTQELILRDVELGKLFEEGTERSREFAHYQVEDQVRNAEIQRLKRLLDAIILRYNEVRFTKDQHGYTMKQIAPVREGVSLKRHLKIVGVVTGALLVLAFGLAYMRELQDNTFKSPEDVGRFCGWPVMAQVPVFKRLNAREVAKQGVGLDGGLYYFYRPQSVQAESYRTLRTALYFSQAGEGRKMIQVTSAEPQDGKSTLAANLALAIANSGKRVLLLDADLRCPTVHTLFGIGRKIGVSDVLAGEIELDNALQDSGVPGLTLLCAGLTPSNPAETLSSASFQQLLSNLRKMFDFIVVDTPPVLAVSDPCIVAAHVDGLLLVVRLGKNKRAVIKRAQDILTTHGLPVMGIVVNGNPLSASENYGYGNAYGEEATAAPSREPVAVS